MTTQIKTCQEPAKYIFAHKGKVHIACREHMQTVELEFKPMGYTVYKADYNGNKNCNVVDTREEANG